MAGAPPNAVGFQFVCELAEALSAGPVELPSFPEVALRVQEVLADDAVSTDTVVRIVGAEPMLAARIVSLANAAAVNPSSTPVSDLRTAVARLGFDSLRAAAVSFAVAQLRRREQYRSVEQPLTLLWLDAVTMAASACVVGRRSGRISPDTALFAGLVAGVGRIYILTRAAAHPALFTDPGAYQIIVRDWHANIARALLESWHVAEDIVEAVHTYETRDQDTRPGTALPDVLTVAALLGSHRDAPELLFEGVPAMRAAKRLGLDAATCVALQAQSTSELATLRAALGR